jgi:hypothetical protein
MPARRTLTMRHLRRISRLHHEGASAHEIVGAAGVAHSTVLEWIDQIFAIEREINGRTAGERLSVRQERVAPLIQALETWVREKRGILSCHDAVAKAIAYLLND